MSTQVNYWADQKVVFVSKAFAQCYLKKNENQNVEMAACSTIPSCSTASCSDTPSCSIVSCSNTPSCSTA